MTERVTYVEFLAMELDYALSNAIEYTSDPEIRSALIELRNMPALEIDEIIRQLKGFKAKLNAQEGF